MKRLFFAALLTLLLAAALVAGIQRDPGYILVAIGNWTLETSFWIGAVLYLALLAAGFAVLALLRQTWRAGGALGRLRDVRRRRREQRRSLQGLIAYTEGDWQRARKLLDGEGPETSLSNQLLAARASRAEGDGSGVIRHLGRARREFPEAAVAVDVTEAELLLDSGRVAEAVQLLERVRERSAQPRILELLLQAYLAAQDWDRLAALLPELDKRKLLDAERRAQLLRQAVTGQLGIIAAATGEEGRKRLRQWRRELSRELARDSAVIAQYARALIAWGDEPEAESELRTQLRRDWHSELVELYGRITSSEPLRQLQTAEGWLREHRDDPVLLLALGRLALRNELWGKAREYLDSSYRLHPGAEVCAELGRLLAAQGEFEKSAACLQRGLVQDGHVLPELPLPKRAS